MNVRLTVQGGGEPVKVDGLLWGGSEPVQFLGMTHKRDGLIHGNGTYLFRPVCWKEPSGKCFVWQEGESRFLDSDPVEIRRIDSWCDPAVFRDIAERNKTPGRDDLDVLHVKIKHYLDECKRKGELPMPFEEACTEIVAKQYERIQNADDWLAGEHSEDENPEYWNLYLWLSSETEHRSVKEMLLDNRSADQLIGSIRYAVEYKKGVVLYLSDLERLAPVVAPSVNLDNPQPTRRLARQKEAMMICNITDSEFRQGKDCGLIEPISSPVPGGRSKYDIDAMMRHYPSPLEKSEIDAIIRGEHRKLKK